MLFVRKSLVPGCGPDASRREAGRRHPQVREIGTHPAAPYLAIADALAFHQAIGQPRKLQRLVYLRDLWVEPLTAIPGSCCTPRSAPGSPAGSPCSRWRGRERGAGEGAVGQAPDLHGRDQARRVRGDPGLAQRLHQPLARSNASSTGAGRGRERPARGPELPDSAPGQRGGGSVGCAASRRARASSRSGSAGPRSWQERQSSRRDATGITPRLSAYTGDSSRSRRARRRAAPHLPRSAAREGCPARWRRRPRTRRAGACAGPRSAEPWRRSRAPGGRRRGTPAAPGNGIQFGLGDVLAGREQPREPPATVDGIGVLRVRFVPQAAGPAVTAGAQVGDRDAQEEAAVRGAVGGLAVTDVAGRAREEAPLEREPGRVAAHPPGDREAHGMAGQAGWRWRS